MAAILCTACGDICTGACEVCGQVCTVPCQLCSKVCDGCCDSFSQVMCSSPFSIHVVVALVFNVPPLWFGIQEMTGLSCRGSQWLLINAAFCLANIMAAVYMALQVQRSTPSSTSETSSNLPMLARASHLFCYDPWIAVYLVVIMGYFCWLWTGAIWSLNGKVSNGCQDDEGVDTGRIAVAMGFGYAFFFFGVAALLLGTCCAYCYGTGNDAVPPGVLYSSSTRQYYSTSTGGAAASSYFSTAYVNADTASAKVPTAAATPIASTSTQQQPPKQHSVPTVQATLF